MIESNASGMHDKQSINNLSLFRTLQEHPMLLQLYRDLVIPQVISSEEFWSQHAAEYTQAKKIQRQEIGVNSAFLVRQLTLLQYTNCIKITNID